MQLCGWKTEKMMRRYAAVTDTKLLAAAEALSGIAGLHASRCSESTPAGCALPPVTCRRCRNHSWAGSEGPGVCQKYSKTDIICRVDPFTAPSGSTRQKAPVQWIRRTLLTTTRC